jgi:hypothetical protein
LIFTLIPLRILSTVSDILLAEEVGFAHSVGDITSPPA